MLGRLVARSLAAGAAVLIIAPLPALAGPAYASEGRGCAVTGFAAASPAEAGELRESLAAMPAHQLDGVALNRARRWGIPAGGEPVLVVDAANELASEVDATVTMFGVSRPADLGFGGTGGDRLVTSAGVPWLGGTTRTVLLSINGEGCAGEVVLTTDRSVFTTVAGMLGLGSMVVFGAVMVVAARRRGGGWARRFLIAAPFGLLAGAGEAVLLHDAAAVDPSSRLVWWVPAAGVALAAVLPLTRRRPVRGSATPATLPTWDGPWQPERLFTRVGAFEVWRAGPAAGASAAGSGPALVKVAAGGRAGEPGLRQMLAREVDVMSRLEHPNCVRPMAAPAGGDGPAMVVMEPVEGTTVRAVLQARGRLPGPQAVQVTLGMLGGVGAVHGLGLVHRGVRPENVWLGSDGRVLLAGFEIACPGLEHAVAAEGGPPYASPEQVRGEALDARSDLWSCAAVLVELLTGRAPDQGDGAAGLGELPEPMAALLAEALAPAVADRPSSAGQLADRLRRVAGEVYGPDWAGRGAVGAAVLAHGAIGSAVAGYAAGGAGTAAWAGGVATSGLGAAAGTGGTAALGAAASGAAASGAAVGGAGAAVTSTGKLTAALIPVGAAAVAVVAAVAAVVAGPPPAGAATEVISPEAAEVIFVRTVDEARVDDTRHLTDDAAEQATELWAYDGALRDAELLEIVVGVPPEQYGYPAWFIATAQLRADDTAVYLFSRFDRTAGDQQWQATVLGWSPVPVMAPPVLDEDGWLAPVPDEPDPAGPAPAATPPADTELVIDPDELPDRYVDWFNRTVATNDHVDDEILEFVPALVHDPENPASFGDPRSTLNTFAVFQSPEIRSPGSGEAIGSRTVEVVRDPAEPSVQWRDAREAIVSFTVTVRYTAYNRPGFTTGSCGHVLIYPGRDDRLRQLGQDIRLEVMAFVPVRQPWRGEPELGSPAVLIDDNIHRGEEVFVPERSVAC